MPAILRLRRVLGADHAEVYVVRLLAWLKYYEPETGALANYSVDEVEAAAEWKGAAGELFQALLQSGCVTGARNVLLCWEDTNGWLAKKAAKERQRKRDDRRVGRGLKYQSVGRSVGRSVGHADKARTRARTVRGPSADKKGRKR